MTFTFSDKVTVDYRKLKKIEFNVAKYVKSVRDMFGRMGERHAGFIDTYWTLVQQETKYLEEKTEEIEKEIKVANDLKKQGKTMAFLAEKEKVVGHLSALNLFILGMYNKALEQIGRYSKKDKKWILQLEKDLAALHEAAQQERKDELAQK
jgi:predicted translin family RNA/ssDNA-binding protein